MVHTLQKDVLEVSHQRLLQAIHVEIPWLLSICCSDRQEGSVASLFLLDRNMPQRLPLLVQNLHRKLSDFHGRGLTGGLIESYGTVAGDS